MEAKKQKKDQLAITSRIWNFIKEDHKFENWLLFILALVLLVLAIYILIAAATEDNDFATTYFNISESGWGIFDAPWKVITISSCIIALAAGSIVYCVWPVFTPSFKELKAVTWTDKKTLFTNSVIVLVFIVLLAVLFYLFDLALIPLFNLLLGD